LYIAEILIAHNYLISLFKKMNKLLTILEFVRKNRHTISIICDYELIIENKWDTGFFLAKKGLFMKEYPTVFIVRFN